MTPSLTAISEDYVIRVHDSPSGFKREDWNSLLACQSEPTPFLKHEYLCALHDSDSAVPATGWKPCFLSLHSGDQLLAACPLYLKSHSYGEYVFDWAWADAYRRHGLAYYPKLLGAVPFTPVPGSRLLVSDARWRQPLVQAIGQLASSSGLSSAHLLFVSEADQQAFAAEGWMVRTGVQFHWQQDAQDPMLDFASMLARLQREKRKKIQQERRRVADQGVSFSTLGGKEISAEMWDFFYHCYTLTYQAHHSTPYLSRDFFSRMAQQMPENWLMFVAYRLGVPVACSLVAIDPQSRVAWGRYWGCVEALSCVHFEACYYQPLAWCVANGYQRFEGGAQGEHKMARGLLPVGTASVHWLRDERFADAVANFLAAEGQGISEYVDELRERNPFKTAESKA